MNEGQRPAGFFQAAIAALREPGVLLGAGAAFCLYLSISLVPFLGIFLSSFTPVPIIYLYIRRGRTGGLAAAALAALGIVLLYMATDRQPGIVVFMEYVILALIMGEGFKWRLSAGKIVGGASGAVIGLAILVVTFAGIGRGEGPSAFVRNIVDEQIQITVQVYESLLSQDSPQPLSESPADQPDSGTPAVESELGKRIAVPKTAGGLNRSEMDALVKALVAIFPGLMIMGTILIAWANFMIVRMLLLRTASLAPELVDLKTWKAPEKLVWAAIACGFALFFTQGWLRVVSLNALMVIGLVYFMQGLCITAYWLNEKGAPPFVRAMIYTFIALQQYLALIIAGVGLFDMWLDFRKLGKAENGPEA